MGLVGDKSATGHKNPAPSPYVHGRRHGLQGNGSSHHICHIHHVVYEGEDVPLKYPYVEPSLCDVLDTPH
jgi:hypothetical protein